MMEASVITESTSSHPYKISAPQGILYGDVYFLAPSNPSKSLSCNESLMVRWIGPSQQHCSSRGGLALPWWVASQSVQSSRETKLSLKGEKCPFVSPPADFGVFNPSQWRSLCPTSNSSQSSSARLLFSWTSHLDERSNMQSKSVNKLWLFNHIEKCAW